MKKVLNIIDEIIKIILNIFLVAYKLFVSYSFIKLVTDYLFKTGDYEYLRYPDAPLPYLDLSLISVCLAMYLIEVLLSVSFLALNLKRKWLCITWTVLFLLEGIVLYAFLTTTPMI